MTGRGPVCEALHDLVANHGLDHKAALIASLRRRLPGHGDATDDHAIAAAFRRAIAHLKAGRITNAGLESETLRVLEAKSP